MNAMEWYGCEIQKCTLFARLRYRLVHYLPFKIQACILFARLRYRLVRYLPVGRYRVVGYLPISDTGLYSTCPS